ncbi:MAG: hypothetical protein SNJ70_06260, partial [Armatimonadota bacterium]
MKIQNKMLMFLISVIPPIIILIWGGIFVISSINYAVKNSEFLIKSLVEERLDGELNIGKAHLTPLGNFFLEDIVLSRPSKPEKNNLFKAELIKIKYNWRELLFQGKGAEAINRVDIYGSQITLVRREDGSFNISDIIKPSEAPPGPPFRGKVFLKDAIVNLYDY